MAEGITRAVITKLTQAGLQVTPWETAQRYGESGDAPERIAQELNVDTVLLGTFSLVEDRILTTLSLVNAGSGLQTWAGEFEEPFEDIFRVQQRIAVGAATSLKRRLTGEEEEALAKPESQSVDAYDLTLQGGQFMQEGTQEATTIAGEYFRQALEIDPNLVDAHVGLGAVNTNRYQFGWGGLDSLDRAEVSYERALELNPASMRARRGLVMANFYRGRTEAALIQGREAARYGRPHDVETLMTRAFAYAVGEHFRLGNEAKRSPTLYRQVLKVDPVNQEAQWRLVLATWGGQNEECRQKPCRNHVIKSFHKHTHMAKSYPITQWITYKG